MAKGPRSLHSPLSVDSEEEEELSVYEEAIVATATTADEVADAIVVASMDVGVAVSSRDKTEGSKPGGGNICLSFCLVAVFSLPLFLRCRGRRLERSIFYLLIIRKNGVVASSGRCLPSLVLSCDVSESRSLMSAMMFDSPLLVCTLSVTQGAPG